MAGQTTLTKYMDAIGNIARAFDGVGLTGSPKVLTVVPGYKRYAESESFQNAIEASIAVAPIAPPASQPTGYFSYWIRDVEFMSLDIRPGNIVGELALFVPQNVNTDMNAAWDFVVNFIAVLGDPANFQASAGYASISLPTPGPIRCSFKGLDARASGGGIALFDFGNYGSGGIQIPDP